MFFGLEVKSAQSKPLMLENTVKLSNAVLEPSKNGKKEPVSLIAEYNKKQFVLCVLDPSLSWQCPLDLYFEGGSEVKFSLRGSGTVHLTGYEPADDLDEDYSISTISSSDEEEEEEEQVMDISPSKVKRALTNGTGPTSNSAKKSTKLSSASKRSKPSQESDEGDESLDEDYSDSDDEDFELLKQGLESSDDGSDEEEDEEISDSDEEEDEDDDDDSSVCQIEEMVEDSD